MEREGGAKQKRARKKRKAFRITDSFFLWIKNGETNLSNDGKLKMEICDSTLIKCLPPLQDKLEFALAAFYFYEREN